MVVVLSRAVVVAQCRTAFLAAARAMAEETRDEPGCLHYEFAVSVDDDAVVLGSEVWSDREALDAHRTHDHTSVFLELVGGMVAEEPTLTFFETTEAGAA